MGSQPERTIICPAAMLVEGGRGVRFMVSDGEHTMPAFAIRYGGRVYAYVNRCSHMGLQLDFMAGSFFDMDKRYIICATHGALYDPISGACRAGPCNGTGLMALAVAETDGQVMLIGARYRLASTEAFEE